MPLFSRDDPGPIEDADLGSSQSKSNAFQAVTSVVDISAGTLKDGVRPIKGFLVPTPLKNERIKYSLLEQLFGDPPNC